MSPAPFGVLGKMPAQNLLVLRGFIAQRPLERRVRPLNLSGMVSIRDLWMKAHGYA
jgi:hypothetical protein